MSELSLGSHRFTGSWGGVLPLAVLEEENMGHHFRQTHEITWNFTSVKHMR